jgi:hypothetical protein
MVEFLIANGAKPSEPNSWSTLAGKLMHRSWLMKPMSEADKEYVPTQIITILSILLKDGVRDVRRNGASSGRRFLDGFIQVGSEPPCCRGFVSVRTRCRSPFQANTEGKTPYDMALASGHQDLSLVLDRGSRIKGPGYGRAEPVELFGEVRSMV